MLVKTNYISMSSLYFLIPTVFILILMLPMFFEVKLSYNIFENSGVICVFFEKIKIKHYMFEIYKNSIRLKDEKTINEKELSFSSPELVLIEEFSKQIKQKSRLKYLEVYYHLGVDDAYLTSIIAGFINSALLIFFTGLKNSRPTASLGVYDSVSFNKRVAEIAINFCVSLTLFDVVYSFLNSLILTKKRIRFS